MKEYPATYKEFLINGIKAKMYKITLGAQAKIEDENINFSYKEMIEDATTLTHEEIDTLHDDQFKALRDDIVAFTWVNDKEEGTEEGKKPSS